MCAAQYLIYDVYQHNIRVAKTSISQFSKINMISGFKRIEGQGQSAELKAISPDQVFSSDFWMLDAYFLEIIREIFLEKHRWS